MKSLGFNTLALANNHFADLGPWSVTESLTEIENRGFFFAGAGTTADNARQPQRRNGISFSAVLTSPKPVAGRAINANSDDDIPARAGVNGISVRRSLHVDAEDFAALKRITERTGHSQRTEREIGTGRTTAPTTGNIDFYGLTVHQARHTHEEANLDSRERTNLIETVRREAQSGFRSLVSIHYHDWEPDWSLPPYWLQDLAHDCVDAGAFAVVGHGPPTMSGFEVYQHSLIAYGLGNFVFHTHRLGGYSWPTIWESVLLEASFDEEFSCCGIVLHPLHIDRDSDGRPGFPRLADPSASAAIIRRIEELNSHL